MAIQTKNLAQALIVCSLVSVSGCTKEELLQQAETVMTQVGKSGGTSLSIADISAGLKEALSVSTNTVVSQLGVAGGFAKDPKIHIPLPGKLKSAQKSAARLGLKYLESKMGASLKEDMKPVVDNALSQVGALQSYNKLVRSSGPLAALLPDMSTDINQYVLEQASDGIFGYLAEEEAAIRANPAKRTTELLKRVFQ